MADVEALLFFLSSSQSYVICFALCRFISHPWNQEIIKLTAFSFVILHPGRKVSTPWVSRRPCSKSLCLVILCLKGSFEFHLPHWQSSSMVFASFSQQLKEVAFKTLNLRIKQVLPPPATNFCLINALKNRKPHNNQTKGLVCRAVLMSPMPLQRQQMRRLYYKARNSSSLPLPELLKEKHSLLSHGRPSECGQSHSRASAVTGRCIQQMFSWIWGPR